MTVKNMGEEAEKLREQLVEWRRRIHSNPELSFREFETSRLVAEELRKIEGMKVETEVGVTGVVGTLTRGTGKTVALRADMDALPIMEAGERPYRSQNPGVMHACGHDAHTAILLGAARLLGQVFRREDVGGTVKLLFQPAEEHTGAAGSTGAPRMMEDGVLDGVEEVIALHMNPERPVGEVQMNDGYTMASVDTFQGTLYGTGGHGAYPHLGTDPTWMLLPVLQALHGIVARRISPLEPAVVSVGQIHAGTASNVIPSEVFIQGTIRTYTPETRERMAEELEKAFSLATALGGNCHFQVERGEPGLYNNPGVNGVIREAIRDLFPEMKVHSGPFGMGAEDFSYMTEAVPGAMFFLGCAIPDGVHRDLHTPIFDIDEGCLPVGAAILAEAALRLLKKDGKR
ncbi:amidohydrolase [Melghirimyces profundicolus]|uniref:Amidohydrolase n=1 Tax=Melghirimyces profundicolus TaxID=1242148 RepID=A0A2T6BQZ0_9BACL|nr:amidohydrolase [Melghirimyces profundicolus]